MIQLVVVSMIVALAVQITVILCGPRDPRPVTPMRAVGATCGLVYLVGSLILAAVSW